MGGSRVCDYRPPFDDADADTILRSADYLGFRVYRVVLLKASHVFRDMFTFPHPGPCGTHDVDDDDHKDGLPLIRLPESSVTLSMLLYAIYAISPSHAPPPYAAQVCGQDDGALDTLMDALLAADKYKVSGLRDALTVCLQTHTLMARHPLRMFGVAYYLHSQTLLRTVAARTLDTLGQHVDLVPCGTSSSTTGRAARPHATLCCSRRLRRRLCRGVPARPPRAGQHVRHSGKRRRRASSGRVQGLAVPVWESEGAVAQTGDARVVAEVYGGAEREAQRAAGDSSATAAMGACADEWESLASKLPARCRGSAASALVLAHTYLAEMLKVEIEEVDGCECALLALKD